MHLLDKRIRGGAWIPIMFIKLLLLCLLYLAQNKIFKKIGVMVSALKEKKFTN